MLEPMAAGPVFWILAIVITVSSLLVVTLKNIFHCALFLMLALTGVAGIFVLLNAEFLAAAQILLYVGAVAVLMVFAIMLTTKLASQNITQTNSQAGPAAIVLLFFLFGIFWVIGSTTVWDLAVTDLPSDNILVIGKLLMTQFMLPFEVVSVLLLAALIGAIALARKESA